MREPRALAPLKRISGVDTGITTEFDPHPIMKQLILASVLGALAMFVFGAVYWMNPLPKNGFKSAKDDVEIQAFLKERFPQAGTYSVPDIDQSHDDFGKKAGQGPVAIMHVVAKGGPSSMGPMMAKGFLTQLFAAFFLSLLMKSCLDALKTYGDRVRFCALVGLVAAVFVTGGNMVWWHHSVPFTLFTGAYQILAFIIGGLVIAKFIRPERETKPTGENPA